MQKGKTPGCSWSWRLAVALVAVMLLGSTLALIGCGSEKKVETVPQQKEVASTPKEKPPERVPQEWSCAGPAGNIYQALYQRFADRVWEKTGGQLKIVVHAGAELPYSATEYLTMTRDGILQMSSVAGIFNAGVEPLLVMPDLPLALDYDELETYRKVAVPPVMKRLEDQWNVKVLTYYTMGPRQIAANKRVATLADLSGMKIRVGGGIEPILVKAWGAVPVTMVFAEVYPALQRGVMEGVMTATLAIQDAKIYEVAPYLLKTDAHVVNFYMSVHRGAWDALPPDVQETVTELVKEWSVEWEREIMHEREEAALKDMVATGQIKEVIQFPIAERIEMRKNAIPGLKTYVQEKAGAAGVAIFDETLVALKVQ